MDNISHVQFTLISRTIDTSGPKDLNNVTMCHPHTFKYWLSLWVITVLMLSFSGCASQSYRFSNSTPTVAEADNKPIPLPQKTEYHPVDWIYEVNVRRFAQRQMNFSKIPRSLDVNSMEDVPSSSWYTPRLGYRDITPEELMKGVENVGPPQLPITVVKAKVGGGNPGFIVADACGIRYLIKFDPPDFPAIETTTALIVNRLFWGFGYNVPEDYLLFFTEDDLIVGDADGINVSDIHAVLSAVAPPVEGMFRATASLLIAGLLIGPVPEIGTRKDDPNDIIPHEDRRSLRAIRTFASFVNHTDMRPDNSLDVYVGDPPHGYIKHYLLDFGEAFGGHGAEHSNLWDGFRRRGDFGKAAKHFLTLGLFVEDWENLEFTEWESIGAFEANIFDPARWTATYLYEPIRRCQPDDEYWAAKILSALTVDHLKTLVDAAQYPNQEAADYLLNVLMERKRKIISHAFSIVTPLEVITFDNNKLQLRDISIDPTKSDAPETRYEIKYYNEREEIAFDDQNLTAPNGNLVIRIPDTRNEGSYSYLRIDIRAWRGSNKSSRPVQFHLRQDERSVYKLVGIVR